MDNIRILLSINKIALLSFFITLFVIIFEIYRAIRQKNSSKKIVIPEFSPLLNKSRVKIAKIKKEEVSKVYYRTNTLLIIIVILLFMLSSIFILISFTFEKEKLMLQEAQKKQQMIQVLSSRGISLFDENWNELTPSQLSSIPIGKTFYIGIATIGNADITKARIRVNEKNWLQTHETQSFNNKLNIYYMPYALTSPARILEIEAQLYSQTDGWLGQ